MSEVLRAPGADWRGAFADRGACALAVGMFDGVHLGHRHMLRAAVREAKRLGVSSAALTFDPHPAERPGNGPFRYLSSLAERIERIAEVGIDTIRVAPFVEELAGMSPEAWAGTALRKWLGVSAMIVGPTHRFGAGGVGNSAMLAELGARFGFEVTVVPHFALPSGPVSSSRIRECLAEGRVDLAAGMLGRSYTLEGEVVRGFGRGRTLGFPTANLVPPADRVLPAPGIYACVVEVAGARYRAGVHVGPVPTFEQETPVIECHLLDWRGSLVGARIGVGFIERLRGIVRFGSQEELVEALDRDIARTRAAIADSLLSPRS